MRACLYELVLRDQDLHVCKQAVFVSLCVLLRQHDRPATVFVPQAPERVQDLACGDPIPSDGKDGITERRARFDRVGIAGDEEVETEHDAL